MFNLKKGGQKINEIKYKEIGEKIEKEIPKINIPGNYNLLNQNNLNIINEENINEDDN